MTTQTLLALLACSLASANPNASAVEDEGPSLTVYSTADPASFDPKAFIREQRLHGTQFRLVPGFGVVRETRTLELEKGVGEIRFTDVAAEIDPTTVGFKDLTSSDTVVLEQNFEFDLVSPSKLLDKYIDRDITLTLGDGQGVQLRGTLLSASGSKVVLKTPGAIEIIPTNDARISMGELPGGLITRPTLVWKLHASEGGEHDIQLNYQTTGLTWRADYNLVLDAEDVRADLSAWVSLMNLSGISYENARLKLVAGDVQRVAPQMLQMTQRLGMAEDAVTFRGRGFEEQSFFEYHLYTLPRRTDIRNNGTQQISLFPPIGGIAIEKQLLYQGAPAHLYGHRSQEAATNRGFGAGSETKVGVYIQFDNRKDNDLGIPIPAGKVRVYKENPDDGALEFIGEDLVDHTARNETIRLKVGDAFDVVGERTQDDFRIDINSIPRSITETYTIEIRNQKDEKQTVVVREPLYRWSNWEITKSSKQFKKLDSRTIEWTLDVPAEGAETITYTVHYTW